MNTTAYKVRAIRMLSFRSNGSYWQQERYASAQIPNRWVWYQTRRRQSDPPTKRERIRVDRQIRRENSNGWDSFPHHEDFARYQSQLDLWENVHQYDSPLEFPAWRSTNPIWAIDSHWSTIYGEFVTCDGFVRTHDLRHTGFVEKITEIVSVGHSNV